VFNNNNFYWQTLRNVVSVFGTLFNDIYIVRRDSGGAMLSTMLCPLAYGPKQKFLTRIDQQADLTDPKIAIKLPRLSFEMTSMTYDGSMKLSKHNRHKVAGGTNSTVLSPVAYRVGMQLNIVAKNQDDALQILEQILPYFQPDYTVTVKQVNDEFKNDMPFTLQGVSLSDDYEGDFVSRRLIVYTLDFETRVKFYSGTSDSAIIRRVTADIRDSDDRSLTSRQSILTNPLDATKGSEYTVDIITSFGETPDEIILEVADGSLFLAGQYILGGTSLTLGVIASIDGNNLKIIKPDALFAIGETVTVSGEATNSLVINQTETYYA
jgi:hypothetical protein